MARQYSISQRRIAAKIGEEFSIALDANPTTGYEWSVTIDGSAVQLASRALERGGSGIGAGAVERVTLRPLRKGTATVRFALGRAWEKKPIEQHTVEVAVDA
jgi:inhibitor of cysteine peptidase